MAAITAPSDGPSDVNSRGHAPELCKRISSGTTTRNSSLRSRLPGGFQPEIRQPNKYKNGAMHHKGHGIDEIFVFAFSTER